MESQIHPRLIRFLFKLKCKTGRITGEKLLSEQVLDAEDIIRKDIM